jgi:hypothetical protein
MRMIKLYKITNFQNLDENFENIKTVSEIYLKCI